MDIKYEIKSFIILLFIWHFVQIYDTVHLKNIICSTANTAAVLSIDSINISHPLVMFTKSVMRRIRIINLLKQSHMSLLIIETQFTIYSTLIIAQPRRCVPLFTYISSRWMVFTKRSDVCRQFRLLRYTHFTLDYRRSMLCNLFVSPLTSRKLQTCISNYQVNDTSLALCSVGLYFSIYL